jgi:hypothetical protein
MNAPAPKFRPVAAAPLDIDDDALMELNDDLGIPTLVKPEQKISDPPALPPESESQKAAKEKSAAISPRTLATPRKKRTTSQETTPSVDPVVEKTKRLPVEVPYYIHEQLRRRVFEERGTTVRYFVLKGLAATGFEILDEDLVPDGRVK